MQKRLLSFVLAVMLLAGLFASLGAPATAAGEIGGLFDKYLTGDKIDQFFTGDPVLTGSCGKDGQGNVMFRIYRVDADKVRALTSDKSILEQNELFKKLREQYPDFNVDGKNLLGDMSFDLPEGMDYYAVKIFGNGEMEDYSFGHDAPWRGNVTTNDGVNVDLEEQLIAAYVQGPDKTYKTGVTNVGRRAFFGQDRLVMVYLGESVRSIGEKAFESCDMLSAINFPSALETLGRRAFYACDYLTFARLNGCTKLKEIPERCFFTCSRLTAVWFPNSIIKIGDLAFAWDHVLGTEQFNLPSNLTTLGRGAFAFCTHIGAVNELTIPSRVSYIGDWAFTCNFAMKDLVFKPGDVGLTIGTGAFAGCGSFAQIHFDNRVQTIGKFAFAACDRLEQVSFNDKNATEVMHTAIIRERAFDSLEDTGLAGLRQVADSYREMDSGEEQYIDGSRTAAEALSGEAYNLSGVTPLKLAAFGSTPPTKASIYAASENMHSFPRDAVVQYPTEDYNRTAYAQWQSHDGMNKAKDHWCGYICAPLWMGHFHEYGDPVVVEATCTHDGYEVYTCHHWENGVECGYVEEIITKEATGHNSEVVERVEPTCTQGGKVFYHCSNTWCDKPDYVEYLPPKGHDLDHLLNRQYKAPTCTAEGRVSGICPDCGLYVDETIPATGHDTKYMTLVKAPTCTEEGLYQGECPVCGFNVRQTVPALGHDWDEGHYTRRPTQTTDGEIVFTCRRCGVMKTEVAKKLLHTHTYETATTAPTCDQGGYTVYTCTDCGDTYTDDFTEPLGHSWDGGKVTAEPTATEDGVRTFTCTRCGATRTESIPATGKTDCDGGASCPARVFRDVDRGKNSWYHLAVDWAVTNGVTNGVDDTHFGPDQACTRGQAVTFLYRAAGSPSVDGLSNPFVDVQESDYFYKPVLWAVRMGITNGTDARHFSPNDVCTRGHIVTFLYRAGGSVSVAQENIPFVDVQPGMWYSLPVLWAVEHGITNGVDATHFAPDNSCTRAHIVTFLYRDRAAK